MPQALFMEKGPSGVCPWVFALEVALRDVVGRLKLQRKRAIRHGAPRAGADPRCGGKIANFMLFITTWREVR
jgi:hypothetical protein